MHERSETQRQLIKGSTLGAGLGLILALFVMVNYLSLRHYKRFDWTSSQLYSLSERSQSLAESIDQEIDMVIFLSPASELYGAVDELLSRYAAANPAMITKREVDPARNLLQAQSLVERYSIERENVVVIATANDQRVISEIDLAEYDYSGAQYGQPPKLTEFKGEQLITSALLALAEAKKPKVVFTSGHGEARFEPSERSLSRARDLLGKDNYDIEEWSSLGKGSVPEGTDLLVVAGPTTNFLPPELELLTDYLASGGRMLMMLDPVFSEGTGTLVDLGFSDWLRGYGVEIRDDIVVDPSSELPFFGPETIFTDSFGLHPIVENLEQTRTRVLLPLARSVSRAADAPADYEVTELVRTSDAGWGETNLAALEEVAPDDQDTRGPVSLGVAVSFDVAAQSAPSLGAPAESPVDEAGERALSESTDTTDSTTESTDEVEPEQARLVVLGDLDFASDAQIANGANGVLLLNALNWLVKREQLIDIEARKPEQTSMSLTQAELSQVYLLVLVILPGLAITLGVSTHMRRRR